MSWSCFRKELSLGDHMGSCCVCKLVRIQLSLLPLLKSQMVILWLNLLSHPLNILSCNVNTLQVARIYFPAVSGYLILFFWLMVRVQTYFCFVFMTLFIVEFHFKCLACIYGKIKIKCNICLKSQEVAVFSRYFQIAVCDDC